MAEGSCVNVSKQKIATVIVLRMIMASPLEDDPTTGICRLAVAKAILTAVKSEEPIEKSELGTRRKEVWRRITPTN